MLEPPGEGDRRAHLLRRREVTLVAAAQTLEEGSEIRELVARAALERAPVPADVHQQTLVGSLETAKENLDSLPVRAEADDHEARIRLLHEHKRPRREQQVDAFRDDQLADEADDG